MATFQAKILLEKAEKEKKWNLSFRFVPTRPEIENSKKVVKKFKKLKNTITASFHAKIGWKRLTEREKMNYIIPFRSYPTRNKKFQKSSEKIQKIKKYDYGFISCQNRLEKTEK